MQPRAQALLYLVAIATALMLGGAAAWFYSPTPLENIDSLTYCACGYSTVRFNDGKITMVKYFHPGVKSGEQIGTYQVVGDKVELDILFKGQMHRNTFVWDNVGLLNPPGAQFPYRYCALNRKSPKTFVTGGLLRLRSEVRDLWDRL